jgi:Fe-S oxidoreductase
VLLHGHCHQKSLVGTAPTLEVLRAIPGFQVSEIPSGCCGMAGSFGYEAEKYELSLKIGEQRLLPAVRQAPENAVIVADGISCRQQIRHATGRDPKHLVEVVAERMGADA